MIRGELILDEGDPFTKLSLDKSIAEIKARRIFRDVKYEVADGSKKNLKVINISVEEQPTGEISAGAGVGSSGGTLAFNILKQLVGRRKSVGLDLEMMKNLYNLLMRYTNQITIS